MTDAHREEEETGEYSLWVHVKNQIAGYLKSTDLNIDGSKNVGVNIENVARNEPSMGQYSLWVHVMNWVENYLKSTDLNIDGSKNVGVNIKTITEENPDATTKNNARYDFSYDVNGRLDFIEMKIGVQTWRKTFTYVSNRLASLSKWVLQ